ncbi:sterile alpha motif-like domain-containing protein [Achromobacter mucicolens]|uniref:YozE family protein n=1 Tax=Achromobacter mucicolens TaxID=1389922 RepID=UPI002448EF68|nr:YozE family protein [Achromobacter mucicolens]MDG9966945.1 sterile alpha motif-like domain-containing protein [Achromobacter mucicolens]
MKFTEFAQWLGQQRDRDDPIGDLARDAFHDAKTYKLQNLDAWVAYLGSAGASSGAMQACRKAWAEYEAGLNW